MANTFIKAWKYAMALSDAKLEEAADPRIQIQQAVHDAQHQHQVLATQAAAVIGNQHLIEMQMHRNLGEVEKYQANARQALTLADAARARGDLERASQYEQTAGVIAAQLVTSEGNLENLKTLHDGALAAAAQARAAVEQNETRLQRTLAERGKLLSQLDQVKMQEQVTASLQSMSALTGSGSTTNLDEVRDKIEKRYATALGSAELSSDSIEARVADVQAAVAEIAGSSRLEQIRAGMKQTGELTAGPHLAPGQG